MSACVVCRNCLTTATAFRAVFLVFDSFLSLLNTVTLRFFGVHHLPSFVGVYLFETQTNSISLSVVTHTLVFSGTTTELSTDIVSRFVGLALYFSCGSILATL